MTTLFKVQAERCKLHHVLLIQLNSLEVVYSADNITLMINVFFALFHFPAALKTSNCNKTVKAEPYYFRVTANFKFNIAD